MLGVTVQGAATGDTTTMQETLIGTAENMEKLTRNPRAEAQIREDWLSEVVADKGYHSNETMVDLHELEIRTYISEPDRGRRRWRNKPDEQRAVYANRRRIRGERGKKLLQHRGMMLERPFAHGLETGGMRRVHLRGRENILKRILVHYAALNLTLILRLKSDQGTPRGLQDRSAAYLVAQIVLFYSQIALQTHRQLVQLDIPICGPIGSDVTAVSENSTSATGC